MGIILATAGSAVGLGNIWRFPYMTGQNGGAAFLMVYFLCVLLLGIPGMISEFIVGRHSSVNAARAYSRIAEEGVRRRLGSHKGRRAQRLVAFSKRGAAFIGILGVITSTIILGFYAVVAGWCLQYLYAAIAQQLNGDNNYVTAYFNEFSTSMVRPLVWTVVFILLTHFVVSRGVRRGIERVSNILMPLLFALLLVLVVCSCALPASGSGIAFLFRPDFSKIDANLFLEALGQAFFSLSLGTACLCTYASYFGKKTRLATSAFQIALLDTLIAILAGLMIFPAAFSVGVTPDAGPSLIFITLPGVFRQAFASLPLLGWLVSVFLYALLAMAALTSTISMHEIGTAFFHEELHISRRRAATIETLLCLIVGVLSTLSMGAVPSLQVQGEPLLSVFDHFTACLLMPAGALLTCVLVGWIVPRRIVRAEFTNHMTIGKRLFPLWLFCARFVCPLAMLAILLHQLHII